MQQLYVEQVLVEIQSAFQKVLIGRTADFGCCLLIDGVMQCSEKDHYLYDAAMLAKMRESDLNVFIMGGGDGFVAAEALKRFPGSRVTVGEIDPVIVSLVREYFDQRVFDDPRVELLLGDGIVHLKKFEGMGVSFYNGIILDLTDRPIGGGETIEDFLNFYRTVLKLCLCALKPGGWVSIQAGASRARDPYLEMATLLGPELQKLFPSVSRADQYIPSFGENNCFLYAQSFL